MCEILLNLESIFVKAISPEEAEKKVQNEIDKYYRGWTKTQGAILRDKSEDKNNPASERVWEVRLSPVIIACVPEKSCSRALREACKKYGLTKRDLLVRP